MRTALTTLSLTALTLAACQTGPKEGTAEIQGGWVQASRYNASGWGLKMGEATPPPPPAPTPPTRQPLPPPQPPWTVVLHPLPDDPDQAVKVLQGPANATTPPEKP